MNPPPRALQRIRWHLADHGWLYRPILALLAVIGAMMALAVHHRTRVVAEGHAVERWPVVEASILEARITEADASSKYHFGTRLSAAAKFAYKVGDADVQAEYFATWDRTDSKDWSRVLAPGGTIKLRVSPENHSLVSLWDHNRVP